jgi:SAM-dependent methyltransferase
VLDVTLARFGEESVEKIVEWAVDHLPLSPQPAVLEIGSGNGTLLFALQDGLQPQPHLCGIDYSPDAVVLARAIGDARDGSARDVRFEVCDFLTEDLPASLLPEREDKWEGWDLVLDKGTLDAIALGDKDEQGRSPAWAYPSRLAPLIRPNGIFLVTSAWFARPSVASTDFLAHPRLQLH